MISFVIPAHNEELHIGPTLQAVDESAREVGEPFEVIVVDDASTDRTASLRAILALGAPPASFVSRSGRQAELSSRSRSRNRGRCSHRQ